MKGWLYVNPSSRPVADYVPAMKKPKRVVWRWEYRCFDRVPELSLRCKGKAVATVFLSMDIDRFNRFNWFVWDRHGVGGENSGEPTVIESMDEAVKAALLWNQHPRPDEIHGHPTPFLRGNVANPATPPG